MHEAEGEAPPEPLDARMRWSLRTVLIDAALVVGVTLATSVLVFRLWDVNLSVPWLYLRDGISQAAITKGILREGWWTSNSMLGVPFGLQYDDYPIGGDNAHWLLIKALGIFSSEANVVTNLYFLASFVLVALSAFFVLRWLGVSRWFALTGAVLFSFLPYHLLRGTWHLTLGAYWSVPIACLLTILVQRDPPPFFRREGGRLRVDWRSRRALLIAVGCLLIGSAGTYSAVFCVVLVVCVAAVRCLAARDLRPIVAAFVLCGIVGVAFVANNASAILYQREHGDNPEVAQRVVAESDYYALRPIQLVAPVPGHRIEPLARITARVLEANNNSEGSSYLGTVGTIGLIGLAVAALSVLAGRRRVSGDELPLQLATPTVFAIAFGVTGGLSWALGLLGLVEIRSWNRISVFIGFYCLAAVVWWASRYLPRWSWVKARAWVIPVAAGLLLVIGVLDQTSAAITPDSHRYEAEYERDARFVRRVEDELQPGDAVFELPYLPFPEAELDTPPYGMTDYDPLRGYLHSDTLEWSYGGMRGREGDWQQSVVRWPRREFLDAITAAGFRGLWIDRLGYADRAKELEEEVGALVGAQPIESEDERFSFFDLQPYADALRARVGKSGVRELRREALEAPRLRPVTGVVEPDAGKGSDVYSGSADVRFVLNTRGDEAVPVEVRGVVRAPSGAGRVTVEIGDAITDLEVDDAGTELDIRTKLRPGDTSLRLTTDLAAPEGAFPLEIVGLRVIPAA